MDLTLLVRCQAILTNNLQWVPQAQLVGAIKATAARVVQAWLPNIAKCLAPLELFLVVRVDMDVLTKCKVVTVDLQALVDTLPMVKRATTEDIRPDASSSSPWAPGQPFDTRMARQFGIVFLSVISRILLRSSEPMADTGWLPFTALRLEFRMQLN